MRIINFSFAAMDTAEVHPLLKKGDQITLSNGKNTEVITLEKDLGDNESFAITTSLIGRLIAFYPGGDKYSQYWDINGNAVIPSGQSGTLEGVNYRKAVTDYLQNADMVFENQVAVVKVIVPGVDMRSFTLDARSYIKSIADGPVEPVQSGDFLTVNGNNWKTVIHYTAENRLDLGSRINWDEIWVNEELSTFDSATGNGTIVFDGIVSDFLHSLFIDNNDLTAIEIPASIINLGYGAFQRCKSLKSVCLENNLVTIGDFAFQETALDRVFIPSSVKTIGQSAFAKSRDLGSVRFEDGSGLKTIGYGAFSRIDALCDIVIPSSVTEIGDQAFAFCPSLTSITLTSKVPASVGKMFLSRATI